MNSTILILSGKTILLTRSKNANLEIRNMFESRGASVVCLPVIDILGPDSWDDCDAAIWKLAEYDCVCFTSRNAVEKFLQRIRIIRPQALNTLATRNLYAVGEKTKSILETNGLFVQPIPQKHSAEGLLHLFYGQNILGKRFLFPKSNIAREVLPQELRMLGATVDEIVTYKTVISEAENLKHIRTLLIDGKIDVITFFSPSSVRNFTEMAGVDVLQHVLMAVIGPTTAEAVKETGLEANIVAKQHTAESLVQGIEDYFSNL